MPSIRSSSRPSLGGWQPTQNLPARTPQNTTPPAQPDPTARSPYMQASMPLMASTGDAFARQFYAKNGLPQQRILPAKRGAGA
jgi:hypothetical protein